MNNEKKNIVAVITDRATAVDLTPIYYIEITKKLKPGALIRVDLGTNLITLEE